MQRRSRIALSRRQLLQSLGLGAAASPLFPLLNASAQTAPRPKRLILIFSPDGAPALNFGTTVDEKPTGTETAFTFQPVHAPFEPFKAKMVVPWGLTMSAGGAGEQHAYGMAGLWTGTTLPGPGAGASFDGGNGHLTGWGAAPSIDQLVAQAFGPNMPYKRAANDASPETRYRSIALGVQCNGPNTLNRMTYTGADAPIHPEISPTAAFTRYFAGVTSTGAAPVAVDPSVARIRAEQKALVDILKGDTQRIRAQVSTADYAKIDAHLEALLAIERLNNATQTPTATGVGCIVPAAPAAGSSNNAAFPTQVKQMMDIGALALACDVTRVLTIQLSYAFSNVTHTWLGHTSGHHTMSHDGTDRRTELTQIDTWYAQQIAYFLGKLDAVNEGSGTLLDNSLVVYGKELGNTAHNMVRVPFLMAGSAGGAMRTGRFLNYDKVEHAKLLVAVGQLMGLTATTIGDRQTSPGPLAGLIG
jgi:hypothetical protein